MATKELVKTTKLVNVYNSANNDIKEITIPSEVSTRQDLVKYLKEHNINHDGNTMMIAETDLVLATDNSVIPTDDFTLVLTPKKVKSGLDVPSASYKEMKEFIKTEAGKNADKVREHFGNYTQLSTDNMRKLLLSYTKTSAVSTSSTKPAGGSIIDKVKALANKFIEDVTKLVGGDTKVKVEVEKEEEDRKKEEKRKALQNKYGDIKLDI